MNESIKTCRLCSSCDNLQPIYENQKYQIALDIFLCTSVKIIDFGKFQFPALICLMCLKELKQAIKFRLKVIEADRRFQSHLQSIGKIDELFQKSVYEPEISIKLENERIKEEPPESFDFIQTIDNIIENCTILDSSNANQRFVDEDNNFQDEEDEESSNSEINRKRKSKKYICNVCKKDFSCKSNLNRHVERKHQHKKTYKDISDKSLFCEMCKQFFTTRGSLQKHMKVKHNSNERFVCDFCGNFFPIKYYLIRHIQTHHNDEDLKIQIKKIVKPKPPPTDSPIPCDVCGKILRNRGLLKPHMRSHKTYNLEDYFYCDLCPRKFKTRGGCVWHIQQRHILKAKFPCTECSAVYKGKWELKCHIKSKHTNIRDYRCEICGKGFLDKQKLTIHTRIHTGERPHACHICPQTFIHQTDLRRHIWGHTGERPYRCQRDGCGKGFMKKSELLSHENRCHPDGQQSRPATVSLNFQQYPTL